MPVDILYIHICWVNSAVKNLFSFPSALWTLYMTIEVILISRTLYLRLSCLPMHAEILLRNMLRSLEVGCSPSGGDTLL